MLLQRTFDGMNVRSVQFRVLWFKQIFLVGKHIFLFHCNINNFQLGFWGVWMWGRRQESIPELGMGMEEWKFNHH